MAWGFLAFSNEFAAAGARPRAPEIPLYHNPSNLSIDFVKKNF
jgi:hypothetical protein